MVRDEQPFVSLCFVFFLSSLFSFNNFNCVCDGLLLERKDEKDYWTSEMESSCIL
jgi:hypothetical protein